VLEFLLILPSQPSSATKMPLSELIPMVNQLQEAFAPLGIPPIDLPQASAMLISLFEKMLLMM
jgi:hypothetical protein